MITRNKKFIETLEVCGKFNMEDYSKHKIEEIMSTELDLVNLLNLFFRLEHKFVLINELCNLLYCFRANYVDIERQELVIDKLYKVLIRLEGYINKNELGKLGFKVIGRIVGNEPGLFGDEQEIDDFIKKNLEIIVSRVVEVKFKDRTYAIYAKDIDKYRKCLTIDKITDKLELIKNAKDDIILVLVYKDYIRAYTRFEVRTIERLQMNYRDSNYILKIRVGKR